ncbi:restriction endonuclease subunit S [Psychrobacter faecalis]|uniref:restriction endonuclease subunit S n=1 Tax=Psychrobacter faecalis TaxID=180588 RepID=UPI0018DF6D24|nr:restriction endonuclease subunit S [Psychrobacter faecalis]
MKKIIESLPIGWTEKQLKDNNTFLRRGKSPVYSEDNQGLFVVNQDCIRWNCINLGKVKYHVVPNQIDESSYLCEGDILINSTGTGTIGRVNQWSYSDVQAVADSHVTVLRTMEDSIDSTYARYFLTSELGQRYLESVCYTGSTNQIELSKRYFSKLELPCAPLPEQKAIAGILSIVDESIKAKANSILSAERLKKSFIQNLLTGKLKPDGVWRSEKEFYIDEKFGMVPRNWQIKKVSDISFNYDSRRKPIKAENRKGIVGDFPYYGAAGIIDWVNSYIFDGDYILFGEDGNNLLSRKVPQAFIVRGKFWANNHAHVIQANTKYITTEYLCEQLESKDYRSIIYGSAQPKINKRDLNGIKILVPDNISEQISIMKIIGVVDEELNLLLAKRLKLNNLRKSLMQNLLTGKVRVDVDKINKLLDKA